MQKEFSIKEWEEEVLVWKLSNNIGMIISRKDTRPYWRKKRKLKENKKFNQITDIYCRNLMAWSRIDMVRFPSIRIVLMSRWWWRSKALSLKFSLILYLVIGISCFSEFFRKCLYFAFTTCPNQQQTECVLSTLDIQRELRISFISKSKAIYRMKM